MHDLQKILLKRLQTKGTLRYAELTCGYDFEDNVVFHLKQLESKGLLVKSDSKYEITTNGIKEIAQYEPFKLEDRGVKTFFLGFLCSNAKGEYLLKSHPQAKVNFYNFPSGKPYFGEDLESALVRTFQYNTGLKLTAHRFKFVSLHLKTIQNKDGEVIFDDAFGIYEVKLNNLEITKLNLLDSVDWFTRGEIKELTNKWPEVDLCIMNKSVENYSAYTHTSDYIL